MPFVICVNMPGCLPESDPVAVATIDEARETAADAVVRCIEDVEEMETSAMANDDRMEALNLPESGGTIGPLSDGYVIDVQRVTWPELGRLAGRSYSFAEYAQTIDAYNDR